MQTIWILVLGLFTACPRVTTAVGAKKCCNNERNLLAKNKCVPDASGKSLPINLTCDEKYVLDPNIYDEDAYNVTANGTLQVHDHGDADGEGLVLSVDEFCLVNQQDEDQGELLEIAIVCFPDAPSATISKLEFTTKAVLIFTSVLFLLLTLYIYFRLPDLRETQDKVTIFTLSCLTIFYFFLGIMQLETPSDIVVESCVALAFVVYFFTMGYFAWLNCVLANVWKSTALRSYKIKERQWYICNHIYAWTVPCVMTSIVAVRHAIKPSIGVTTCWFHHDSDQWKLVYLPISIMLALNVFLCCWTSFSLMRNDFSPDTRRALRSKCMLYVKLFLLGGFTWIFEVLSYVFNEHSPSAWFWMVVDAFNCLHGVLIFFVLVVWRRRIKKELANKEILCYTCPSHWANVEDDEEEVCLESEGKGKYDLINQTLK